MSQEITSNEGSLAPRMSSAGLPTGQTVGEGITDHLLVDQKRRLQHHLAVKADGGSTALSVFCTSFSSS